MRRTDRPALSVSWCLGLAALLGPITPWAKASSDDPRNPPRDERMAAVIAAVRAEEAKVRDIEYDVRTIVQDDREKDPVDPTELAGLATRRVVFQGIRSYIREESFTRTFAIKSHIEEVSAYDGERTRTVVSGNCANIHLGRFVHPRLCPPHSLPLAHLDVSLPLSVYLEGTDAIRAYLGIPAGEAVPLLADGAIRVVPRFVGEEDVEGVRCVRVGVGHITDEAKEFRHHSLWLAPSYNYHCVKEESTGHKMHVTELRQIAPGVWFPWKIDVGQYDSLGAIQAKRHIVSHEVTTARRVDPVPHNAESLFRDVAIPDGLPVFTIKDRALDGSKIPQPIAGDRGRRLLGRLAERVAEQARRYDPIEVRAVSVHAPLTPRRRRQTSLVEQAMEEHSIRLGERMYSTKRGRLRFLRGSGSTVDQVHAYDGQWTRFVTTQQPEAFGSTAAIMRHGAVKDDPGLMDSVFTHQPHALLLRDQMILSPLTYLLGLPAEDRPELPALRFHYCGETQVDGHPRITIVGGFTGRGYDTNLSLVVDLATDRNLIPIRLTTFVDAPGVRPLPTSLGRAEDLREIAPGLWYPFRVVTMHFQGGARMARGQLLIDSRDGMRIDSVTLQPAQHDAIFSKVVVPGGTNVSVSDETGHRVGFIRQDNPGVPTLSPEGYRQLLFDHQRKAGDRNRRNPD